MRAFVVNGITCHRLMTDNTGCEDRYAGYCGSKVALRGTEKTRQNC